MNTEVKTIQNTVQYQSYGMKKPFNTMYLCTVFKAYQMPFTVKAFCILYSLLEKCVS